MLHDIPKTFRLELTFDNSQLFFSPGLIFYKIYYDTDYPMYSHVAKEGLKH